MKREFLKGLGIEDENLISQILDEAGKDLNAKKSEITNLRAEIANKDKEMESLKTKGKSADSLAEQVKELQKQLVESENKNTEIQFSNMLDKAFASANSIDNVSLKANLDLDAIKNAEDKEAKLNEQIEKLKTEKAHLFKVESSGGNTDASNNTESTNNNNNSVYTPSGGNDSKTPLETQIEDALNGNW